MTDFACVAADTEVSCDQWCGRKICALKAQCVRPRPPLTRWQRITKPFRIFAAWCALHELETHYRALATGGVWGPGELAKVRLRVGEARVNLAIARS